MLLLLQGVPCVEWRLRGGTFDNPTILCGTAERIGGTTVVDGRVSTLLLYVWQNRRRGWRANAAGSNSNCLMRRGSIH